MDSFQLSRRGWVRIVSFIVAAFLVLFGAIWVQRSNTQKAQRYLALGQLRAFQQLSDAVSQLDLTLEKASFATSPAMLSQLCGEISTQAQVAQVSLGELPYSNVELERTSAFVARVGDYASALSRSAQKDGGWTENEAETWAALSQQAGTLSDQLAELEADIQNNRLTLESVEGAEQRMSVLEDGDSLSQNGVYDNVEEGYDQLPTLIYDGPFSQHLDDETPAALDGLSDISEEEAISAAQQFLEGSEGWAITSTLGGSIPGWLLEGQRDGESVSLEVSQAGGKVIQFSQPNRAGYPMLTQEKGVELAQEFLEEHGYSSMIQSYYEETDGTLTVNFAYLDGDTVCYPDLVKVSVALDTGSVTGFEAKGYLTSHQDRTLTQPTLTAQEAEELVPEQLNLLSVRKAVIPTDGGSELSCWEVKAEAPSGRHVIYYLNGDTGAEEKIFLLQESESGTLVL
jgi:germination protein YpeB